jgi:hypothetical protein
MLSTSNLLNLQHPARLSLWNQQFIISAALKQMLLMAAALAVILWGIAYQVRINDLMLTWDDQISTFTSALTYLSRPYDAPGFYNAPWTMLFLAPFDPLPLEVATLLHIMLYCLLLALIVHKFGGGKWALLVALTSALAVDMALEVNIDWLIYVGLLVPPAWSAPFLMIKPQAAWGYVFSFRREEFIRASLVGAVVLALSFLIWGNWPQDWQAAVALDDINPMANAAPLSFLPVWAVLPLGLALGWYAFRKRDPLLCTIAGVFFVPYIAVNSLVLIFTLLSIRWTRAMFILSGSIWLMVGWLLIQTFG